MAKISRKGFVDGNGNQVSIIPVVAGATAGNLAVFNAEGELQDSGKKPSDFAASDHTNTLIKDGGSTVIANDDFGIIFSVGGGGSNKETAINENNIVNLKRAIKNPDETPIASSDKLVTSGGVYAAIGNRVFPAFRTLHLPSVKIGDTYYYLDYCPFIDPEHPAYAGDDYVFDRHTVFRLEPVPASHQIDEFHAGSVVRLNGFGDGHYYAVPTEIDPAEITPHVSYTDDIQKPNESGVSRYVSEGLPLIMEETEGSEYYLCSAEQNYTYNGLDFTIYFYDRVVSLDNEIERFSITAYIANLKSALFRLTERVAALEDANQ